MSIIRTPLFFITYSKIPGSRVHVIVPKRVAKKAVERNHIKRLLREAILHSFSTVWEAKFTALPSIVGKTFQEIKIMVEYAMKKT